MEVAHAPLESAKYIRRGIGHTPTACIASPHASEVGIGHLRDKATLFKSPSYCRLRHSDPLYEQARDMSVLKPGQQLHLS